MMLEEDDNIQFNVEEDLITPQFISETTNLNTDITYLDMQISSIQKHIVTLESTISVIEQTLNNRNTQAVDKTKLYGALNKTMEILSMFHSNQQRFLDLKFKYRKEQDDLKYKIVRMINIELEQFNKHNQSNMDVLETLKKFNFMDKNNTNKLFDEIEKLNNNPIYEY